MYNISIGGGVVNEIKVIDDFYDLLFQVKKDCETFEDDLHKLEDEICDIQHILGVPDNKLTAPELIQLALELRKKLQERWELKHRNRLIKPIKYFLERQNDDIFEGLEKTADNMKKAKEDLSNLIYYPKVRQDLAEKYGKNCPGIATVDSIDLEELKDVMESKNAI